MPSGQAAWAGGLNEVLGCVVHAKGSTHGSTLSIHLGWMRTVCSTSVSVKTALHFFQSTVWFACFTEDSCLPPLRTEHTAGTPAPDITSSRSHHFPWKLSVSHQTTVKPFASSAHASWWPGIHGRPAKGFPRLPIPRTEDPKEDLHSPASFSRVSNPPSSPDGSRSETDCFFKLSSLDWLQASGSLWPKLKPGTIPEQVSSQCPVYLYSTNDWNHYASD